MFGGIEVIVAVYRTHGSCALLQRKRTGRAYDPGPRHSASARVVRISFFEGARPFWRLLKYLVSLSGGMHWVLRDELGLGAF
ncbi:hypothetical protein L6452_02119 [Arctium lappa]|uniref:Uncharacterized protein n=1 Tax=Arctium lappa TaxID=4217 RepID=A0ACB9FJF7_ARCLA|nr:hypothetical protein L6452_02119 [Arctium lappa]